MRLDILTIFPEMFQGPFDHSIIQRAKNKAKVEIHLHNIRDHATDKHRRVDDYAYSAGAGMVMMNAPIVSLIEELKAQRTYDEIIFMTPDGEVLNQSMANKMSSYENIMILCGHYKGVDERVREKYITLEISVGDYVLSGGEIGAMILTDSLVRLIPGVLGDETSALSDSFQDGLLSPPVYTRPADFKGQKVPEILLSGNDKKITEWKHQQALERTKTRRPDLYKKYMED
ncbi:MAG: tRNA (guanosine(37)-N1)-methyltransferase TrmD [Bacteroidetes bacterium 4572_77]|nr:MAG: tRNA (guanosine(37)-N1)-methyltransferase TrmD [Bacteroidetes bacterium 4572_77]